MEEDNVQSGCHTFLDVEHLFNQPHPFLPRTSLTAAWSTSERFFSFQFQHQGKKIMIESVICLPLVILHRWIDVFVSRHVFFIESLIYMCQWLLLMV